MWGLRSEVRHGVQVLSGRAELGDPRLLVEREPAGSLRLDLAAASKPRPKLERPLGEETAV